MLFCLGVKHGQFMEEYRLSVFEIRVLGETFGTKMEEVAGAWRKLRNEKLQCL